MYSFDCKVVILQKNQSNFTVVLYAYSFLLSGLFTIVVNFFPCFQRVADFESLLVLELNVRLKAAYSRLKVPVLGNGDVGRKAISL